MTPGKIFIIVVLLLFIGLVGYEVVNFSHQRSEARQEFEVMKAKLDEAKKENTELSAQLEYYSHPENLEKELRARFNYKRADEKIIILVPASTTKASSTQ